MPFRCLFSAGTEGDLGSWEGVIGIWLATTLGFYSVVEKRGGITVRARTARDLDNLVEAARLDAKVLYYPCADYQFRVLLDRAGLKQMMAALSETIDYPNFKEKIMSSDSQAEKEPYYLSVWERMAAWGDRANGYSAWDEDGQSPLTDP